MTKPKTTKSTTKPSAQSTARSSATPTTKSAAKSRAGPATNTSPAARSRAAHPRSVPVPEAAADIDAAPDQPFEEGARDAIGADLRHRMISEAAYYRYAERGYADGYDIDDWTAAEAEIDHLLLIPEPDEGPAATH